jgi:hypothetical protein
MRRFLVSLGEMGVMCLAAACGEAPAAPGAQLAESASEGGESQEVLETLPPRDLAAGGSSSAPPPRDEVEDAGGSGNDSGSPSDEPAYVFTACTESTITGCDYLHIAASNAEAELCVQLTLDNCSDYGRGIGATVPSEWQLGSGSVTKQADLCELDEYYLASVSVSSARGNLTWNVDGARPTGMVIALELMTSRISENSSLVPNSITLQSDALVGPLEPCDD